jgi:5-methylcytosine-specific restriction protein A
MPDQVSNAETIARLRKRMREGTTRPGPRARGYTTRWDREARQFRKQHPLCALCLASVPKRYAQADVVDHVVPHKGDMELFWDRTNWQSLCKPCHDGTKQQQEVKGYSKALGDDGLPIDPNHPFYRRA